MTEIERHRFFNLVSRFENGEETRLNEHPMTHDEVCNFKSRFSESKYRTLVIKELDFTLPRSWVDPPGMELRERRLAAVVNVALMDIIGEYQSYSNVMHVTRAIIRELERSGEE